MKRLSYLFIFLIFISFASASVHKQNTLLDFSIGAVADDCILEGINTPTENSVLNLQGIKQGNIFNFKILGENYTSLGNYCHIISCDNSGNITIEEVCYEVTYKRQELNGWKIALQIFASMSCLFIMSVFLFFSLSPMRAKQLTGEEKPTLRFFFSGLALLFLVAHILLTNVILHNVFGVGAITETYSSIMWMFFIILIAIFIYILIRVALYEVDLFRRRSGLK